MSATPRARYVVDDQGQPSAVLLDIDEYRHMLDELEELEAIRVYDAATDAGDEPVSFEQATGEIEQRRT